MTKYRIGFVFPKNLIFASTVWIAFVSNALATDIQCNNPGLEGSQVICDYVILNSQYERIFKQQTDMVESGRISPDVVDAWRKKRDQCTNVACMDSVFSEWKATAETAEKSPEVNQSNKQSSPPRQETLASPAASVDQQPSAPAPPVLPSDFPAESAANEEAKTPAEPTNQAGRPEVQTVPAAQPNSDTSNGAIRVFILLALIVAPIWYLKNKFSGGGDDRQLKKETSEYLNGTDSVTTRRVKSRHVDEDDEDERTEKKQVKIVEKPMYASSDESFPRGWTACATCDYWIGTRDVIYGQVKVQKKDYDGKCAQGPVVRAHFKANSRCTHWKKWGALNE